MRLFLASRIFIAPAECSPLGEAKEREVNDPEVMNAEKNGSSFGIIPSGANTGATRGRTLSGTPIQKIEFEG
jgi:hypothetical protein